MSGDKDYYQLLTGQVSILSTARRAGQRIIGPGEIPARYGVTAGQWCDFRALSGDPSDGLPGVRGVGPRTAARLLADGLALDDLPASGRLAGRAGAAVLQAWDQVLTWRDLIRMRTSLPVACDLTGQASPRLPLAAQVVEELGLW